MNITKCTEILDYWFPKDGSADYNKWFLKSKEYDKEIKKKFGNLLKEAEKGKGYGWLVSKDSFVAYIILMDQFSRHIYRDTKEAFKNDNGVLIFTELGFELYKDQLDGYEFMFAFMPYMHTESLLYQKKGENIFNDHYNSYGESCSHKRKITNSKDISLMDSYTPTKFDKEYQMLKSMKPHMDGHKEVIKVFGRFPKRNKALGRTSTEHEIKYLNSDEVKKRPY
mgnify:CR=1 FL=1